MDPYEADPTKIPATDPYADIPFYGRYRPCSGDFVPNPPTGPSTNDAVIRYWEGIILDQCTPDNRMYDIEGWRDIFALGSVILKSNHLSAAPPHRDHAWSDANEPIAIALVADYLGGIGIQVPIIYFQGKVYIF
jgi:COMPASS component SPP1